MVRMVSSTTWFAFWKVRRCTTLGLAVIVVVFGRSFTYQDRHFFNPSPVPPQLVSLTTVPPDTGWQHSLTTHTTHHSCLNNYKYNN
ncbi:hypothetical protein E2C01_095388 [Portunus trituberculatus]|uniref:Uncharacterized protein n=1 Tax=Portunus trituberculatus TaxID=210409 RepID=A0A5B7JPP7_PORTR|nr:hypothetical protein [Portunus trituberculatus]